MTSPRDAVPVLSEEQPWALDYLPKDHGMHFTDSRGQPIPDLDDYVVYSTTKGSFTNNKKYRFPIPQLVKAPAFRLEQRDAERQRKANVKLELDVPSTRTRVPFNRHPHYAFYNRQTEVDITEQRRDTSDVIKLGVCSAEVRRQVQTCSAPPLPDNADFVRYVTHRDDELRDHERDGIRRGTPLPPLKASKDLDVNMASYGRDQSFISSEALRFGEQRHWEMGRDANAPVSLTQSEAEREHQLTLNGVDILTVMSNAMRSQLSQNMDPDVRAVMTDGIDALFKIHGERLPNWVKYRQRSAVDPAHARKASERLTERGTVGISSLWPAPSPKKKD